MTLHDIDKHAIKVTLQTKIKHGSETETYELVTFGTKMYKGADLYLQYKEENETGKTQTTIKHKPDETILLRNGAIKMRQLFPLAGSDKWALRKYIWQVRITDDREEDPSSMG